MQLVTCDGSSVSESVCRKQKKNIKREGVRSKDNTKMSHLFVFFFFLLYCEFPGNDISGIRGRNNRRVFTVCIFPFAPLFVPSVLQVIVDAAAGWLALYQTPKRGWEESFLDFSGTCTSLVHCRPWSFLLFQSLFEYYQELLFVSRSETWPACLKANASPPSKSWEGEKAPTNFRSTKSWLNREAFAFNQRYGNLTTRLHHTSFLESFGCFFYLFCWLLLFFPSSSVCPFGSW